MILKLRRYGKAPSAHYTQVTTNPFVRRTGPDTANGRYYDTSIHTIKSDIKDVMNVMGVHDDSYRKIDGKSYFEKPAMTSFRNIPNQWDFAHV